MRARMMCGLVAVLAAVSGAAWAQDVPAVGLPASPVGQSSVQLGGRYEANPNGGQRYRDGKWIVVDYGRPLLRGRKDIFGAGAEYGKTVNGNAVIWRAGANATTRLTTQAPLEIGGKTVPPGVYNVFVDLKPGSWTFVLNTQPVQVDYDPNDKVKLYGAYNYDAKFDVLRVPMAVKAGDVSVEQFTIGFVNVTDSSATLTMAWDRTVGMVDLKLAATK